MQKTVFFKTISGYDKYMGVNCHHPNVTVIDYAKLPPILFADITKVYGFYVVFLKGPMYTALKYGRNTYDYRGNELVFAAPNQAMASLADGKYHKVGGYALAFHSDFVAGTQLEHTMQSYPFFSYSVNKSLSLSRRKKNLILHSIKSIQRELGNSDELSNAIIFDNIKLILDNSKRFYNRQFDVKNSAGKDILSRFEAAVDAYLCSAAKNDKSQTAIQYCAKKLSLSPSYLSNQIKAETGLSALNHIRNKILERAKESLFSGKSVSEIAEELGFSYPQHFSRWFKNAEGMSPNSFRAKNALKNALRPAARD